jgi:type II secretory pathway pseudopilin PulG
MNSTKPTVIRSRHKQMGLTLIELLVAGIISLIAASGMIIVMANTLGTGSQTIQMARLSQEMRTAMQIMSRELRRANYHSTFLSCYGNTGCLGSGFLNIADKIAPINITDNGDSDCFWFWYDRPALTLANSQIAAFRRTTTGAIGKLQMTTSSTAAPSCNLDADWVDITDPSIIDVQLFNVVDAGFTETINTALDTQSVERIGLTIRAKLVTDPLTLTGLSAPPSVLRELQEFVTVRNNTTAAAP